MQPDWQYHHIAKVACLEQSYHRGSSPSAPQNMLSSHLLPLRSSRSGCTWSWASAEHEEASAAKLTRDLHQLMQDFFHIILVTSSDPTAETVSAFQLYVFCRLKVVITMNILVGISIIVYNLTRRCCWSDLFCLTTFHVFLVYSIHKNVAKSLFSLTSQTTFITYFLVIEQVRYRKSMKKWLCCSSQTWLQFPEANSHLASIQLKKSIKTPNQ